MTRRVAVASVLVVALVVGLVGWAVYARFAHELGQQDDDELTRLAARPAALLLRPTSTDLAQLRAVDGAVSVATPALAAIGILPPAGPGFATVALGGRSLRVYTRVLPGLRQLSVALDRAATTRALHRLRRLLILGGIAAAGLTAIALVLVIRRSLAPLREVARTADTIARTTDLSHRVAPTTQTRELEQLSVAINHMLDRLEASDGALRRLVADASHELRTPLTTVRGNLELLRSRPTMPDADRQAALDDASDEIARMQALLEGMLALARSEEVVPRGSVHIRSLVAGAAEGVTVSGDEASLRRMLDNLVANAERYAGGAEVLATASATDVEIRVVDHGPGIAAAERERIFDRFYRAPGSQGSPGSGLGLAIARTIARAHRGDIELEETPGGGATFVVRLPREG